jgi:hypothetical protein
VVTTMKMPGGPSIPPMTTQQCLTAKQPVPHPGRDGGKNCSVLDVKRSGDTFSWHIKCADARGAVDGTGSVKYEGDRFSGSAVMHLDKGGQKMEMTQTLEGHRIGDCAPGK